MFNNKRSIPVEIPYNQSKEYLNKQQRIDYLLVLTRLYLETPYNTDAEKEIRSEASKQISTILQELK